jgi:hypothetical protein
MDAPWIPFFLAVIFLLHPNPGLDRGRKRILYCWPWQSPMESPCEIYSNAPPAHRSGRWSKPNQQFETPTSSKLWACVACLARKWSVSNTATIDLQTLASNRSGIFSVISKFVRLCVQVGILGVGAWLVIQTQSTAGGMIAGTILPGRALAPVDQALSSWRGLVAARGADPDDDNYGMTNQFELAHAFDPLDPSDATLDPDNDGLDNLGEFQFKTDPNNPDTDGDGVDDGTEVANGTNPRVDAAKATITLIVNILLDE